MNIRLECHLAKYRIFKKIYYNAHFEFITRTVKSHLSPSWNLLHKLKNGEINFETYKELLIKEISENPEAIKRIRELREIAKEKLLFLVCYERDWRKCHRSIIKDILEKKIKTFPIEI
jgi:uncharacterized protein YeaO (DUF488 family)